MKFGQIFIVVVALGGWGAAEAAERDGFRQWRVWVGGAFNGGVRAKVGVRNLPPPSGYAIPHGLTRDKAAQDAADRVYGDGFIRDDNWSAFSGTTENWKLPVDAYDETTGYFNLRNPYEYVDAPSTFSQIHSDRASDECQYGISAELNRELWVNDETATEKRWGLDLAAAFSYFFQRGIYRAGGRKTRVDHIGSGAFTTDVEARDTMFSYIEETDPAYRNYAEGGMYGKGNPIASGEPALILGDYPVGEELPTTRDLASGYSYWASGDYRELEMLFMLRPWYELKDWWRVFAQVGVGVSWGCFESTFSGLNFSRQEDFAQWDCYGVAGVGTIFRYKRLDIMFDVNGRFLRDDLEVDGRYVHGGIARSDWGLRLMLGYEF